ncbi:hypothetical protein DFH07DRAFT_144855 [Mycena maculata]|uniref:Uncharacterized protein n=1 Tax=Mycena maculata TaxID=230809 RepID=A0AAD7I0M0_9AGAR|nr:hypothetical protein DFH07DRAFT_144855 [Mycena maculata]
MDLYASNTDPAFPPELEHQIFKTAAILYPKIIPTLLCVARRILAWIEPLLYTFLRVHAAETKRAYDDALLRALASKPRDFFPNVSRQMYLTHFSWEFFGQRTPNVWSSAELERLLRMCPGITDLLFVGDLHKIPLILLLETMRPTRLAIMANITDKPLGFGLPFFQRVTHLHLFDINGDLDLGASWPQWPSVLRLPALTHFGVPCVGAGPLLLARLPRLTVLVLYIDDAAGEAEIQNMRDPRVVIASAQDFLADWDLGARGHDDVWVRAEAFISRKRKGEIQDSSYHLEPMRPEI